MTDLLTSTIDHIVHLSPPGELEAEIRTWQKWGFKVVPGGTHADGLTENALVAFRDGAYLELISFTHPLSHYPVGSPEREKREQHPWGKKDLGFIDFAFLGNNGNPSIADIINMRSGAAESHVNYLKETPGGRKRKDGEILKWLITAPAQVSSSSGEDIRGRLPFFCGDLTPRHLRVPSEPDDITHPNTSVGIGFIHVLAPKEQLDALSKQLTVVLGIHPDGSLEDFEVRWTLQSPGHNAGRSTSLKLRLPQTDEEKTWLEKRGAGVYEVAIRVEHEVHAIINQTPHAKLVRLLE